MNKITGASCDFCPYSERPIVLPECVADVPTALIVGESPGDLEVKHGKPFVGPSGVLLDHTLRLFRADRSNIWITNAVLCHPPIDKAGLNHASHFCRGALLEIVNRARQRNEGIRVVALGSVAAEALGISRQLCFEQHNDVSVIALPHPAHVLRQNDQAAAFMMGLRKVFSRPSRNPVSLVGVHFVERAVDIPVEGSTAVVIDVETTGMDFMRDDVVLVGVGILRGMELEVFIIPREYVQSILRGKRLPNVGGHNFKFDLLFLQRFGVPIEVDWDTMVMAHLWNEYMPKGLKELSAYFFDAEDYRARLVGSLSGHFSVAIDQLSEYLCLDLYYTAGLYVRLSQLLKDRLHFAQFQAAVCRELTIMEHVGVHVDRERLDNARVTLLEDSKKLVSRLQAITGALDFNPNSPQQCARFLYQGGRKPPPGVKVDSENSTSMAVLDAFAQQGDVFAQTLIRYRRVQKMLSAYIDPITSLISDDERVHPNWRQTATVAGRISAANPSIQNVPRTDEGEDGSYGKLVRSLFTAGKGNVIVAVDGSQWELRTVAGESGDPFLIDVYKRNGDIHGEVAKAVFGPDYTKAQRTAIKHVVFGWLYGGSVESSAEVFQVPRASVAPYIERFNARFAHVVKWREEQLRIARKQGYLQSRAGRRFHFHLITYQNLSDLRKLTANYPIQGAASDLTMLALTLCGDYLRSLGAQPVIVVHDSIVVESPEEIAHKVARTVMDAFSVAGSTWYPELPWAAEAEVGSSWGEMSPLDV